MSKETIYPTIHLDGTSKNELLDDYYQIAIALEKLTKTISEATFHNRDYYPQDEDPMKDAFMDDNAFSKAYDQRLKHLRNLHDFGIYITNHINHILDQD
jgi:hypothetical protein